MNLAARKQRKPIKIRLFALLVAALGFAGVTAAQTITGTVYGTVTDTTGAVLPDVSITLLNMDTGAKIIGKTNTSGMYVFPVVDPGSYEVTAVKTGFTTLNQTNLHLAPNQNVNAGFTMQVGAVAADVNVSAAVTLVDTRESQLSETIDQQRVQNLPLVGRSAYDLVQLIPGITIYTTDTQVGNTLGTEFSTNGGRVNFNSFYLDGAYDTSFFRGGGNILPNPDALDEFRILTSNFDAEFGRLPGAVVNTITRAGANKFHGTAYDYLRNNILTAKNYFASNVTHLVYNDFGGGTGGPIIRNRAFFFGSYQGLRIGQPVIISSSGMVVPTALERTGNFTQSAKKPTGTFCGTTYVICSTALDPVAMNILKFVPLGINGTSTPPQQQASNNVRSDQGTGRLDYQLTQAHKLQFTYFNSQGTGFNRTAGANQLFTYGGNVTYGGITNYVVGDDWIVSPRAIDTIRLFRTLAKIVQTNAIAGNTFDELGGLVPEGVPQSIGTQPYVSISGYFGGGAAGSGPDWISEYSYGGSDTFNLSKGNHTLKLGVAFTINAYKQVASWEGDTQSTFSGTITGNALADFLQGRVATFGQNNGTGPLDQRAPDPSLFAQDDWRVSRRLTLNLGVRWEVYYPFAGQNNLGTFTPNVQSTRFPTAPLGLLSSGDPGVPDGLLHVSYRKVAPRVGFAYDVFGKGTTSLRGAYGIFYAASAETLVGNLMQQPFALAVSINNTNSLANPYLGIAPFNGVSPFPYAVNLHNPTFTTGAALAGIPPNEHSIPYMQEYNLTLERQFGNNWSTRVAGPTHINCYMPEGCR